MSMKIDHKQSYIDFGEQFKVDKKIDGYHGSIRLLKDIVRPFKLNNISGKKIMEIGSGSGRILKNLIKFKPIKIIGIEPSDAAEVARKNINSNLLKIKKVKAENIKFKNEFNYVFSLGVIHHIPQYEKVVKNVNKSLKKGGKFICWVYGYEGNEIYILIFNNIRRITILLPDFVLRIFCYFINFITYIYGTLCKYLNLPLRNYFLKVFNKCDFSKRNYIIFDQLNPSYAKYFKKHELYNLMKKARFKKINIYNRHNYSWTVIAEK